MSAVRQRLDEFRIALMLLTRLPAGRIEGKAPSLAEACWAYPLVGVLTGVLAWLANEGALALGFSAGIAAVVALGVLVLVTGGLHHDGLADFADGIGGGRDRAHRLEIMRDSRIGSYGVLALILVLALMALAIADMDAQAPRGAAFVLMGVASRYAMLAALLLLPPARQDGLGRSASSSAKWPLWLGAVFCGVAALAIGTAALPALAAMALVALIMCFWARRAIGGQTGDVLGAVQLASETAGWLALSVSL